MSDLLTAWRQTKDFLRDRLVTSGRSDVSINAVLRVMNSAFDDDSDSLDAAWAEALAALPEGWAIVGVARFHETDFGLSPEDEWAATAGKIVRRAYIPKRQSEEDVFEATQTAYGHTPAVALRVLAVRLREVGLAGDLMDDADRDRKLVEEWSGTLPDVER